MIPRVIAKFVRQAPLYQQFPRRQILDSVWQRTATLLYAVKMQTKYGRIIRTEIHKTKLMRNSKKGLPALIIANGPSAKDLTTDQISRLTELECEFLVMNEFYKNEYLASKLRPSFYFLSDPIIEDESKFPTEELAKYLIDHQEDCLEVRPAWISQDKVFTPSAIFFNPISASGITYKFDPTKWRSYPDGVLFVAICMARFLGYSPILLVGADNSMYLHHFVDEDTRVKVSYGSEFHSYPEVNRIAETLPHITRKFADVLYAHARFLNDLEKFCSDFTINVGVSDRTNDSLPRACLLPRRMT